MTNYEFLDRDALIKALYARDLKIQALAAGLRSVEDVITHSNGVDGLVGKGALPWCDFRRGGSYSYWLADFDDALETLR